MLLVDTNIFLAGADRRSDRHGDCAWLLRAHHGELATTVAVIAEISWLLLDRLGPASQADLLRMVLDVLGGVSGAGAWRLAARAARWENTARAAWRLGPPARWLAEDATRLGGIARGVSAVSFGFSGAVGMPRFDGHPPCGG